MGVYRISPSVLSYGWAGCKHCFYRQIKLGERQPSIQLPRVFTEFDKLAKDLILGRRTDEFCSQLPAGVVRYHSNYVLSEPIMFGANSGLYFSGYIDIAIEMDVGGFLIPDLKTGSFNEKALEMYGRQVHAYAHALEHPAHGRMRLSPVEGLGVLYWSPEFAGATGNTFSYGGMFDWREVERDDASFMATLREIVALLDGPEPAPFICAHCEHCSDDSACSAARYGQTPCTCCWWCIYRHGSGLDED
jgi:hypothetical protein